MRSRPGGSAAFLYCTLIDRRCPLLLRPTSTYISTLPRLLRSLQCYEEAGMWQEALRVCQRHLPHLAHKVQAQYQVRLASTAVFTLCLIN